jgi:hypothetical protein
VAGVAVNVITVPELYVPPPDTVPPPDGLELVDIVRPYVFALTENKNTNSSAKYFIKLFRFIFSSLYLFLFMNMVLVR